MAPSVLLDPESPPTTYTHPLKQKVAVPGANSLEATTPANGAHSVQSTANGGGFAQNSHGFLNANGASGIQLDGGEFITAQSLLQQAAVFGSGGSRVNGGSKKPNILYIMADQMAAPMQKFNDPNSVIKTPHLDELARTGVNFASAYCNSPLCAPSRFTMCSGQLPSKIGGYDNASILGPEVPTYAHYLRREGYETALAGKMHFIGPDQLHGFEHR
jgi:hypothetical protein